MTTKRDSKLKPKQHERPKLKKETLKDLDARFDANAVIGGLARRPGGNCTNQDSGCASK